MPRMARATKPALLSPVRCANVASDWDAGKRSRLPRNLLFVTNVRLSAQDGVGGVDQINKFIKSELDRDRHNATTRIRPVGLPYGEFRQVFWPLWFAQILAPGAAMARVDALKGSEKRFFGGDAVHG